MKDTFSISYSSDAKIDLMDIYAYIAFELNAPATALRQINRIRGEIHSLDFSQRVI